MKPPPYNNHPAVPRALRRAHRELCLSARSRGGAEPTYPGEGGDRRDRMFQRGEWLVCRLLSWCCARHSMKASVSDDIAEHVRITFILGILMFGMAREGVYLPRVAHPCM